jgi:hypothetical protein
MSLLLAQLALPLATVGLVATIDPGLEGSAYEGKRSTVQDSLKVVHETPEEGSRSRSDLLLLLSYS